MKNFFLINGILELLAGIAFVFAASMVPGIAGSTGITISLAQMYGVAAIVVAVFSFLVYQRMENASLVEVFMMVMLPFHLGICVVIALGFSNGAFPDPGAAIFHGLMFILFVVFFMRYRKAQAT